MTDSGFGELFSNFEKPVSFVKRHGFKLCMKVNRFFHGCNILQNLFEDDFADATIPELWQHSKSFKLDPFFCLN